MTSHLILKFLSECMAPTLVNAGSGRGRWFRGSGRAMEQRKEVTSDMKIWDAIEEMPKIDHTS